MAKSKLNLQAYQQDILARLQELSEGGGASTVSRLGVVVNGANWLISLDDVSEVIPVPEVTRVPQTQSWFMGMANVRGNLYALTDLSHFLGYAPTTVNINSRILLVHQKYDMNAGLLVERLVGLRSTQDMEKQETELEQAPWYGNQYRDANNEVWNELNVGRLLTQHEFMQVAA